MINRENTRHSAVLRILVIFFFILIPLIQVDLARDISSLPKSILIGFFSILLLGNYFLQKNYLTIYWHPTILPGFLFIFWCVLSYTWSIDPFSTKNLAILYLSYSVIFFVLIQASFDYKLIYAFIFSSVVGGVIVALIGIGQAYGFNPLSLIQKAAPASTFVNRNFAAQYLDAVTPLAFISILLAKSSKQKWLLAYCLAFILAYHILTFSRGSWLALAIGFFILLLVSLYQPSVRQRLLKQILYNKTYYLTTIFCAALILVYPFSHHAAILADKLDLAANSSIDIRLTAYTNALLMIPDHPFKGIGLGSFMLGFRPYMFAISPLNAANEYRYLTHLHDDPLQFLIELGLPGLSLFLIFYFSVLFLCLKLLRSKNNEKAIIGAGLFLVFLFMGIHSLVSFPFYKPVSGMMFWASAALTIGLNAKPAYFRYSKQLVVVLKYSGLSLTILLFAIFFFHYAFLYLNSFNIRRMADYYSAHDCQSALKLASFTDFRSTHNTFLIHPIVISNCNKNPDSLFKYTNNIIQYDSHHALARMVRGNLFMQRHDYRRAKEDFLVAAKIIPHRPGAYVGLGQIALHKHQYQKAIQLFNAAKKRDPENKDIDELRKKAIKYIQ